MQTWHNAIKTTMEKKIMELKILVIHPHDEIRSPICEILSKDNNSIQEFREIPLDHSFIHQQNFDLIFAPFYDENMSVTPIFTNDKIDFNNNPLLIGFTEDRNPKERYTVFKSNAFDTIPLFCEEEYLLLGPRNRNQDMQFDRGKEICASFVALQIQGGLSPDFQKIERSAGWPCAVDNRLGRAYLTGDNTFFYCRRYHGD
jgi:hypothetical protein